jgi:hypothetical protein
LAAESRLEDGAPDNEWEAGGPEASRESIAELDGRTLSPFQRREKIGSENKTETGEGGDSSNGLSKQEGSLVLLLCNPAQGIVEQNPG